MSTEQSQLSLCGRTMGTTWSVELDGGFDGEIGRLEHALQAAVQEVDAQMSTWNPESDLMQFNAAPVGSWVPLPLPLFEVLGSGLAISEQTRGAFEMNVGDAVRAWGFCSDDIDLDAIQAASQAARARATEALVLDVVNRRAQKTAPLALDLSGIAKGYGVDRLVAVAEQFEVRHALCSIDGELRAIGDRADGVPWTVGVEMPDTSGGTHSVVEISGAALATSGDYRHFVEVKDTRLGHTMDPRRGSPKVGSPASVTVIARTCMEADAMATALMVMGPEQGPAFSQTHGLDALFLMRGPQGITTVGTGIFK